MRHQQNSLMSSRLFLWIALGEPTAARAKWREKQRKNRRLFSASSPPPNICLGRRRQSEGEAAGSGSSNKATRRQKVAVKGCRSQRPPSETLARRESQPPGTSQLYVSDMVFLAGGSEGANQYGRTRRTGAVVVGWREVGAGGWRRSKKCLHRHSGKSSA